MLKELQKQLIEIVQKINSMGGEVYYNTSSDDCMLIKRSNGFVVFPKEILQEKSQNGTKLFRDAV